MGPALPAPPGAPAAPVPGLGAPPARLEVPGNPTPGAPGPESAPSFDRAKAESRVRVLGTLYQVAGGWTLLAQGYALAMLLSGKAAEQLEEMRSQPPFSGNPDFERWLDLYQEFIANTGVASIPYFLSLGVGAFYVWAGVRLRGLEGRGMAMAAAISMIVLFLCSSQCCGCCFTIPLGVAALFILTRADTEAVLR